MLSAEKSKKRWKPMDSIVQSSAVNEATKWRRLFPLGSSAELFAVVQQEGDGQPYEVIITTDVQFPVVLHWGISKQGVCVRVRACFLIHTAPGTTVLSTYSSLF